MKTEVKGWLPVQLHQRERLLYRTKQANTQTQVVKCSSVLVLHYKVILDKT